MSTTTKIAAVLSNLIESTPALSQFDPENIYIGVPPSGFLPCVSIDGTYSVAGKTGQRGTTIHIWMAEAAENIDAGDIHDIADIFKDALVGTALLPGEWTHLPEPTSGVDHVALDATAFLKLL